MPAKRFDDRRLVELHVVGQDGNRVVRAQADVLRDLVGPADDQPIHVREPLGGGERGPAVDDDRLVAKLCGQPDQRARDLHRTDDDEPRPHREHLDEVRRVTELQCPRGAALQRLERALDQGGIEVPPAERAIETTVLVHDQLGLRGRAAARLVGAELGRWRNPRGAWSRRPLPDHLPRATPAPRRRPERARPARRAHRSCRRRRDRRPTPPRR